MSEENISHNSSYDLLDSIDKSELDILSCEEKLHLTFENNNKAFEAFMEYSKKQSNRKYEIDYDFIEYLKDHKIKLYKPQSFTWTQALAARLEQISNLLLIMPEYDIFLGREQIISNIHELEDFIVNIILAVPAHYSCFSPDDEDGYSEYEKHYGKKMLSVYDIEGTQWRHLEIPYGKFALEHPENDTHFFITILRERQLDFLILANAIEDYKIFELPKEIMMGSENQDIIIPNSICILLAKELLDIIYPLSVSISIGNDIQSEMWKTKRIDINNVLTSHWNALAKYIR